MEFIETKFYSPGVHRRQVHLSEVHPINAESLTSNLRYLRNSEILCELLLLTCRNPHMGFCKLCIGTDLEWPWTAELLLLRLWWRCACVYLCTVVHSMLTQDTAGSRKDWSSKTVDNPLVEIPQSSHMSPFVSYSSSTSSSNLMDSRMSESQRSQASEITDFTSALWCGKRRLRHSSMRGRVVCWLEHWMITLHLHVVSAHITMSASSMYVCMYVDLYHAALTA